MELHFGVYLHLMSKEFYTTKNDIEDNFQKTKPFFMYRGLFRENNTITLAIIMIYESI